MSEPASGCHVFKPAQLLPESWRRFAEEGVVRAFNPGLLREGPGWLLAYRIVGPDGLRRIGICRLDETLRVLPGSAQSLSDHVHFRAGGAYPEIATKWFADPRLYRFAGRLFVYWNSGWHEPRNFQFLQELAPKTLLPVGHPRELVLAGERQKLEKNWTFFTVADPTEPGRERLLGVYSIAPHRILEFSLQGDGDIAFAEIARTDWTLEGYPASHGGLRGGTPPILLGGEFWAFGHSVHDSAEGYRYAAAAYRFSGLPPFAPTAVPVRPLALGNPFGAQRTHARLNPAVGEVIYPCGAAWDGARWVISHGINDEYCAITTVAHATVEDTLRPLADAPC